MKIKKIYRFCSLLAFLIFCSVVQFSYAQHDSPDDEESGQRDFTIEQELDRVSDERTVEEEAAYSFGDAATEVTVLAQAQTPQPFPDIRDSSRSPNPMDTPPPSRRFNDIPPGMSNSRDQDSSENNPDNSKEAIIKGTKERIEALQFKDMDINDVLNLMSDKMGLNIIAGRNVSGKVTIFLKDVDLWDALRIILESNDLAYVKDDNIIRIMTGAEYEFTYGHKFAEKVETKVVKLNYARALDTTVVLSQMKSVVGKTIADEKANTLILIDTPEKVQAMANYIKQIDLPRRTEVYDLSYAKAEDVFNKVKEVLTPSTGDARFDPRSNKLIVSDTPLNFKNIEAVVNAFDVQEKEVLIEAKIVQVVLSDRQQWGINWEAIVSDYHDLTLTSNFDVLGDNEKSGTIGIGTSDDNWNVILEALDTAGDTNILSNPHITALNNQEAKILVGSTEPYVTSTTTTPAAGPTTTAETVNFIEVGIKLYVTPQIHNDGFITMKIKPEVSSVTRNLTTSNNNTIPVVETSEAETTVIAKEGVTIIIGGLIKDEKIDAIKSVPVLGKLPVLGFLFRSEDKQTRKTELVIFLTTKILTGDVPMDRPVEDEAGESE